MDRQYEYTFIGDSDHHGFLSYHAGEYAHSVDEKGIVIWNFGLRISECGIHSSC